MNFAFQISHFVYDIEIMVWPPKLTPIKTVTGMNVHSEWAQLQSIFSAVIA